MTQPTSHCLFTCHKAAEADGKLELPITRKRAHAKAGVAKLASYLRRLQEAQSVHFDVPSVKFAYSSEACNAPGQDAALLVLLGFHKHRPVSVFAIGPLWSGTRDAARSGYIKNEKATGLERVMDSAERAGPAPGPCSAGRRGS